MGLFDDDYSFDDLLGDLDFSYSVGTDTSDDVSEYGSSVFDIYDTVGADSLDAMLQDELYGGSGSFLDMIPSYDFDDYSDYSWLDDLIQEGDTYSADDITGMTDEELAAAIAASDESMAGGDDSGSGPLGLGIIPGLRNFIFGQGSGPLGGNVLGGGGLLGALLGLGGQGGGQGSGLLSMLGIGGGEGGGFGGSPLLQYLMMKSLLKDQDSGGSVPIGGEAYGGPAFNYQDYQPTKLQPALLPGVGYGNAPGMMKGGLAAFSKVRPGVAQKMGYKSGGSIKKRPGDITFAKLEPGEFVVRREAVDAVGIPTLEQINSMGR